MAYAAVSLAKQKIERLLGSSQPKIRLVDAEAKSIYGELCSLESVLKDHTCMQGRKLRFDPLEQQIEDVADKIVDMMESLIPSDESESPEDGHRNRTLVIFSRQLLDAKQEIASLTEKASLELRSMEEDEEEKQGGNYYSISTGICHSGVEHVGLEDELEQLKGWLAGGTDKREIVSVTGMAGIGKSTLVQEAYYHASIVSRFETRLMVTIGPSFRLRELLLLLLDHLGVERHEKFGNYQLGMLLHGFLEGRRYLIVLDDVWDNAVWFWLGKFFPLNHTSSRVILTTRLSSVAHFPHSTHIHEKHFLDDNDSWDLLRRIVFTSPKDPCSFELEKIGKKIAKNCEGLPLAIVSVGKLLCQVEKTVENWKKVSEDDNPLGIGIDDNSPISKSLSLSYNMLPHYLKSCFLYVGVFPQSYEISVTELIRLWVVEGFITQQKGKRMEDIAELWLDDLISRSVVLFHECSSTSGKTKTCRIHFVFRNLCISIAQKEKFCHILKKYAYSFPRGTNRQRRLCVHNNVMLGIQEVRKTMESISYVRSLLCLGVYHTYPLRVHLNFSLLKVLNALKIRFYVFPHEILELVRLEYLAITYHGELPKSISQLRNLEVLIVNRQIRIKSLDIATYLPVEIWNLKWLKHLQCLGFDLLDSCTDGSTLKHLLSLSGVSARSCAEGVLARMHNLKKLGIHIELGPGEEETFNYLSNVAKQLPCLESFKCVVLGFNSQVISQVPDFPSSIKKITLSGCKFSWKCMSTIYKLRSLKVLKLQCNSFSGPMWELHEEECCQLEFLLLEDLDMEVWIANSGHFPKLERLIIKHCYKLCEIPIDFGNIKTLKRINVEDGRKSVGRSAEHIQGNHQLKYGKDHLQVHILSSSDEKKNAKPRP